ncbi:hypothetical protein A2867_01565 [Candidatus Daviesbacteria bacterium RIFCSPHIGHO2_01_FULL_40_11]|uniref:Uncharacterized protein n=1 Tax=Candidatus Daviesbacteria bacterium RIFCSPHIGHO2_01_FULL_40_11 TaxID=1797762 RepID=A0A1F5JHD9_9BACT|nr:MAG: hypothetical protein A2867_01565 [Candidatus Daviesbacteria bacterium RIFCSPHIGHO2_01_FULL_40_11]OGE62627.1 MAG: hypothetical protein A2964_02560 [Candidatus Daviesbacteria bacterium RIFCSPLOWO2_01_FULL_40_27]
MKPISALSPTSLSNIKLISFDADGVMIEKGTEILERNGLLTIRTKKISQGLLKSVSIEISHYSSKLMGSSI